MRARLPPELAGQLKRAGDGLVQVVVQLRPGGDARATPSPEDVEALAKSLLARVERDVGSAATRTNILRNVGALVVEAEAKFVRSLIRQPEVISALPNRTAESPYIPPKGKRPA